MASANASGYSGSETETLAIAAAVAFLGYKLLGGLGKGVADLGTGAGGALSSIGTGIGTSLTNVTGVLPWVEGQLGSFGNWAANLTGSPAPAPPPPTFYNTGLPNFVGPVQPGSPVTYGL